VSRTHDLVRAECARYLQGTYVPRLARALEILPEADLWWRPHPDCISVGNVLLHLEGNVHQWIVSGLGGAQDRRERADEFAADGAGAERHASARELLERLAETVRAAAAVIEGVSGEILDAPRTIQGFETTGLGAILHVVEHFSWHTGQVVWIAKARAGVAHGLSFYDDAAINAARNSSRVD
jgi:uncharacterized damage-inducible protein DinB